MKKMSLVLFLILLLLVTACSNNVVTYKGESDNWSVSCVVQNSNSSASYEYEIRYLGKNPSSIENVNYKFISENINISEETPFNTVIKGKAENRPLFLDEDQFVVEIGWEGNTEKVVVKK